MDHLPIHFFELMCIHSGSNFTHYRSQIEEEEEELRSRLGGAGVNKVYVHRTSMVIPP